MTGSCLFFFFSCNPLCAERQNRFIKFVMCTGLVCAKPQCFCFKYHTKSSVFRKRTKNLVQPFLVKLNREPKNHLLSVRLAAYFPRAVCSAKHGVGRERGWRIVGPPTCFVSVSYTCIPFSVNRAPQVAVGSSRLLLGRSQNSDMVFLGK